VHLPGSVSPKPGGGCAESGPGVLPDPGDRTSSFIAPPYDSDELGGLCETEREKNGRSVKGSSWELSSTTKNYVKLELIELDLCRKAI